MKILYIGSGFVGTCSAAVSADSGHNVLLYDIDQNKVNLLNSSDKDKIESCLFEDGLAELMIRHKERIEFTADYKQVESFLEDCDAVFMCLPTPEIGETGESDLTYYFNASKQLSEALVKRNNSKQEKYIVIINKSTVPIEMVDRTEEIMKKAGVENFGVVSNPEFLVEGKAIEGSIRPDRVVVGASSEKDFEIMRNLYQRFHDSTSVKYLEVNPKEAAAGKLLANFYLFNKLAVCFDVIGRTTETFDGLNFENLRKLLTTDPRIGSWGFYDSLFAGGSCFIKDARSLSHQLQTSGQNATLVNETYLANKRQLELFIGRAERELDFDWSDKTVALLGTAFKQDTNDIRNSPSIDIVNFLKEKAVKKIKVFDPVAIPEFKKLFPESEQIEYVSDEKKALKNSEAVFISTDWPQFREIADFIINNLNNKLLIMDGRRMLQHRYDDLENAGFNIIAVGSSVIKK
jgi:UDPglucose 6-dehydrogenase